MKKQRETEASKGKGQKGSHHFSWYHWKWCEYSAICNGAHEGKN
jgi:hypothetical protein